MERLPSNLSRTDRMVRVLLGVILLALPLSEWVEGLTAAALLIFAWVPIVTGLAGWCPVYILFGFSTSRR